jgi:hypothetical protein
MSAAVHWAYLGQSYHHGSTLHVFSTTLSLLQRCLILSPTLITQHRFLTSTRYPLSLASDAASCAIETGELEQAVQLLEQGRALLWSEMHGFRTPLDRLR